jgi:hypothetical protein
MAAMKLFTVLAFLAVGVAIACSGKSAGVQSSANNAALAVQAAQPIDVKPQEKSSCTLDPSSLPAINGLKLGMTPQEVKTLFPGSENDTELQSSLATPPSRFGVSNFVIRPSKYDSKGTFAGINQITFLLLDGRVSEFSVGYNSPEYAHVDKLVDKVTQGTALPASAQWEPYVGMENLKVLKCVDFEMRVFIGGPGGSLNYVLVKDLAAEEELKDRKKKAREKASPTP